MTKSSEKLSVALIGCGKMGTINSDRFTGGIPKGFLPVTHAEAIHSIDDLELTSLCDNDEGKLALAESSYKIDRCFTDYKNLIEEMKPDIVSIATRTHGRCDIVEFAANHGVRGIHIEKPLSTNLYDCRRALDAVIKNNVKITYGTTRRFMEIFRKAKEIIHSGEIGDIIQIVIEHGKTLLMWNHPHSVDTFLFLANCTEVEYVQAACAIKDAAVGDNIIDDDPVVENAFIKFNNKISALITSGGGMNTRIYGTMGTLTIEANGSYIEIKKRGNPNTPFYLIKEKIEMNPVLSGTERAFYELALAVKSGGTSPMNPYEIELSQKVLLSIALSSIKDGVRLSLLDLDENFTVTGKYKSLYA